MTLLHRDPVGIANGWFGERLLRSRRWAIQLGSLVLVNSYFFPWFKRIPCAGMNCYACPASIFACPIGVLQQFSVSHKIPLYTIGFLGLIGALVGRLACGWFCPFGLLQDALHKIRVPKLRVSNRFGWTRYAVLVLLVGVIPYLTLETWFSKLCPVGTLEAGIPILSFNAELRNLIGGMFILKLSILAAFLVGMVFIRRPFCRFFCPLGAIYSLFNRFSSFQVAVDKAKCTKCDQCQKVCPTDIKIYENAHNSQCIRCLDCIKKCPVSAITVTHQ
jgi:ferredoxin-type protein NapH